MAVKSKDATGLCGWHGISVRLL